MMELSRLHRISIKPLSVNEAYTGRRFKTPAHKAFKRAMALLLPRSIDIPEGRLLVMMRFGFSNALQDIDGAVKQALDAMQDKYGFNDNRVYSMALEKVIVKRGREFIEFLILAHPED